MQEKDKTIQTKTKTKPKPKLKQKRLVSMRAKPSFSVNALSSPYECIFYKGDRAHCREAATQHAWFS